MRTFTFLALIIGMARVVAAPVPQDKPAPPPPFPMKLGDGREYVWRSGDTSEASHTDAVTQVDLQKDGATRVTLRRTYADGSTQDMVIRVADTGLSRVADSGKELADPVVLLKLPATAGVKWESAGSSYEVLAEEEVAVPAGKYQTMKVVMTTGVSKTTLWFAPSVGLVKMQNGDNPRVMELKAFTPGK